MRLSVLIVLAIGSISQAWGQALNDIDPRYMYLQADYIHEAELKEVDADEEGDGYGGKMSVSIAPHAFIALEYHSIDNSAGDLDTASAGLGLRKALLETLDFYGSANYEYLDLTVPGLINGDADGYGGRLGLRLFISDQLELFTEGRLADFGEERIGGVDVDIDSRFVSLGVVAHFTNHLALVGEFLTGEYELDGAGDSLDIERDDIRFGLRWYLGT